MGALSQDSLDILELSLTPSAAAVALSGNHHLLSAILAREPSPRLSQAYSTSQISPSASPVSRYLPAPASLCSDA